MPTFTGNLTTIGLEPRPGLIPFVKCNVVRAAVSPSGQVIAGSREFTPDTDGDFTLTLASTVGAIPYTQVKLTGGWLGDDAFFELPLFTVPETDGTLADLIALSDIPALGVWGKGFGPPPDWFNGFIWLDISGETVLMYPREI